MLYTFLDSRFTINQRSSQFLFKQSDSGPRCERLFSQHQKIHSLLLCYSNMSQNPTLLFFSLRLKNANVCNKPFWQMQMPLKHQKAWKHTWKLGLAQTAQWNHCWAQLLSRYLYQSWAQLSYVQIRLNNIQPTEPGQTVLPWRKAIWS